MQDVRGGGGGDPEAASYWSLPTEALFARLRTGPHGLRSEEARARLASQGPNALEAREGGGFAASFAAQLRNPLAWLLGFAVVVSSAAGEWTDAAVVLVILFASAVVSAAQERRASRAVEALRSRVALRASVLRDGALASVPVEELVPGDVIELQPGTMVGADAVVLEARDFEVSQAALTGETFPVQKSPGACEAGAPLAARGNVAYQGTSVRSGWARAVVARTGRETEFGRVAQTLSARAPETDFERGIRRFGYLLTRVMLVLVVFTFAATVMARKPALDSLLFAVALAVGLAPEMLPAVVAVTLAHGARAMAERGVIVRRLSSIENLGSMGVLCTDKTGTLTEGAVRVEGAHDADGRASPRALSLAATNARMHAGLRNPLDEALASHGCESAPGEKLDEVVYDFVRKRVSVAVRRPDGSVELVTKGAFAQVLAVCDRVRGAGLGPLDATARAGIEARAKELGEAGLRVLAVATRVVPEKGAYGRDDESGMVFEGVVTFLDPPKAGAAEALRDLRASGVRVQVVSGDARAVTVHLAAKVGLEVEGVLTGAELNQMSDESLRNRAPRTTVFAEVDPNQKERVIRALRAGGAVVGYMGDGINDAPALHAADVAISVEGAVDVAREAADLVLLRPDLGVLHEGIGLGRKTFANTLKYLFATESANFGNMMSMAVAAAALPFLPLLAKQVLLNNFLSDVPSMAIGTDAVDPEQVATPRRWDLREMRNFMLVFGLVSSAFDLLTFALLLRGVRASEREFRSGWFVASLLTEVLVAFVVRTRKPFYRSRPSRALLVSSAAVCALSVGLLYSPAAGLFSLVPLPGTTLAMLLAVAVAYMLCVEALKRTFFRRLAATS